MEIKIDLTTLKRSSLTPNQLVLLYLMYYKNFDDIAAIFSKKDAIEIRNTLLDSDYILSQQTTFRDTILSNKHVEKLLNIRADQINFWEFYSKYPIKVGSRILRASGDSAQVAQKHEKKYLSRVRTKEAHETAINALEAFVAKQKQAGKLEFLPNMETVMNNSMWEQWEVFIQESGTEQQDWNTDAI
jgi:hypothetical protein